ncbi:nucleotide-diphospho-sugar transferase [Gammaproteobacteria bacterium]|nr:nucleotide-diphospho-sugar transferase [Gammaproteobacteria bacterium]
MKNKPLAEPASFKLEIPVLFLTFNRIDSAQQVFFKIKQAQPPKLYLSSDGARDSIPLEREKVQEIRDFIISNIDWDCEIYTLFNDSNLGCKTAVSSAINWFFDHEERGIVLEDDCLPSISFFQFCQELLYRYEEDERIFLITGYNHQNSWKKSQNDYFFSNLGGIWGWASWRRAWLHYDVNIRDIDDFISQDGFNNSLGRKLGQIKQHMIYSSVKKQNTDTWAMQWGYARHKNNALTCTPSLSLIKNIGFGHDATHTFGDNLDGVRQHEIKFPLKENSFVVSDQDYDELMFKKPSLYIRIKNKVLKYLN